MQQLCKAVQVHWDCACRCHCLTVKVPTQDFASSSCPGRVNAAVSSSSLHLQGQRSAADYQCGLSSLAGSKPSSECLSWFTQADICSSVSTAWAHLTLHVMLDFLVRVGRLTGVVLASV